MKAVDWVAKFEVVPASETPVSERFADIFKEFMVETAELITARTKTSKPESRFSAADGAVREQKNKFRAICMRVPTLTESIFDLLLAAAIPEFEIWKTEAKKRAEAPKDNRKDYRKNKWGNQKKGN